MNGEELPMERRNGLSRYNPFITIINSIATLALAGGIFAWAISQEKNDSDHNARISANEKELKRIDRDVLQNRTDIQHALKEIRDELREINRRLDGKR